jgi:hypothetical protein
VLKDNTCTSTRKRTVSSSVYNEKKMLRRLNTHRNGSSDYDKNEFASSEAKYSKNNRSSAYSSKKYLIILCVISFLFFMVVRNNKIMVMEKDAANKNIVQTNPDTQFGSADRSSSETAAFASVVNRAILNQQQCKSVGLSTAEETDFSKLNNHTAHLKQWGILDAVRTYQQSDPNSKKNKYPYQCQLPPENECQEDHFTVVFMAYNPDRLQKMMTQIKKMLSEKDFSKIVAEVIVVWNGERHIDETDLGKKLVELGQTLPIRISYPLKAGFPNDLMNRYHPRLQVKTKAIMYYDDDGPFYSYRAVLGGFELWKRNSNAQIGAMARKLDLGPRQTDESNAVLNEPGDRYFVSQCPTDEVHYNYYSFANFGARMVLPSGSFLRK